jgi:hypothetical protein
MDCLSDQVLDSDFGSDATVFVVMDESDPNHYLYFPKNKTTLALFGFMKLEDATHIARLIVAKAPKFKGMTLGIYEDSLQKVRKGAEENKVPVCIWSPIDSLQFFEQYEDMLGQYYGFD